MQDFFIQPRIKVVFIWKHLESKLSEVLQKKNYLSSTLNISVISV
jgi:hypothetical protein